MNDTWPALGLSGRVVASCFDLYLLHLGLDRYRAEPDPWPRLPEQLRQVLKRMGPPQPLPGTAHWGNACNPYLVIRTNGADS